jgi:GrpB-like predicted nucleotidyltransferase (UPF0157 family)
VSVSALEPRAAYAEPLERLGYLFAPDPAACDYHFFGRPAQRPRTHHVHVCAAGSHHERRHLALRDYLRAHDEEAARYGAFKRALAASCAEDRLAYIAGKERCVAALETRALQWLAVANRAGTA